ncbi:hypothetical protein [Pseudoalteromonas phage J2-1_QLiu-2017]|nr:hypothetical protein [Pseudoalteromonas phage J2-1_QLiu-2017]
MQDFIDQLMIEFLNTFHNRGYLMGLLGNWVLLFGSFFLGLSIIAGFEDGKFTNNFKKVLVEWLSDKEDFTWIIVMFLVSFTHFLGLVIGIVLLSIVLFLILMGAVGITLFAIKTLWEKLALRPDIFKSSTWKDLEGRKTKSFRENLQRIIINKIK